MRRGREMEEKRKKNTKTGGCAKHISVCLFLFNHKHINNLYVSSIFLKIIYISPGSG